MERAHEEQRGPIMVLAVLEIATQLALFSPSLSIYLRSDTFMFLEITCVPC